MDQAFFDGIDFWDDQNGMLISDPIDGRLLLYKTTDAGDTWQRVGEHSLPPLLAQEYGFAASGSGIVTTAASKVWIATGGDAARVFHSPDGGNEWEVITTPVFSGKSSAGIFSLAFRDAMHGIAVGGDYLDPNTDQGNIAITSDGGQNWELIRNDPPIFHKASIHHLEDQVYLTTGRTGSALTRDDGRHWEVINTDSYYCITYHVQIGVGYLAGADGHVARFTWK